MARGDGGQSLLGSFPTVPLESMDESYKHELVREQAAELLRFFVNRWTKR
ncbi:DUF2487 family protein [Geobacillus thermodenitrificans]